MPERLPQHIRDLALELGRTMTPYAVHAKLGQLGHKVAPGTVYRWLEKGASKRIELSKDTEDESPVDDEQSELPEELSVDLEDIDFKACERLIKTVEQYMKEAKANDAVRTFTTLARLSLDIRERMHRLRPVKPPDPAKDPANIQAREILFRNLQRMIEEAEKRKV